MTRLTRLAEEAPLPPLTTTLPITSPRSVAVGQGGAAAVRADGHTARSLLPKEAAEWCSSCFGLTLAPDWIERLLDAG
jgi:hypothetical protein